MRIVRFVPSLLPVAAIASCLAVASPAFAQDSESITLPSFGFYQLSPHADSARTQSLFPVRPIEKPDRPGALLPLYGSLIALQGLDFHSTRRAIESNSGREANPALRDVVHNSAAFVAVKAGATAGVIWASEKMWKKNRKAAVIFTALVNVGMAAIVANNYRVAR